MNRIDQKFKSLSKQKKKAFIAFITAGDPNLKTTEELVLAFEKSGVDIVELGVPFSDPLADGPTIQEASYRALKNKVSIIKILDSVKRIRKVSEIPICLMTYYNPVFHFGDTKFVAQAKAAGVDGVIIPDLPPEEASELIQEARKKDFSTIFFLSPTTKKERISIIEKASSGFIYYVSIAGVTGARKALPKNLKENLKKIKRSIKKPLCVGFGISNAQQAKEISKCCDGVIVGSAIIKEIIKNKGKKNLVSNVTRFVSSLSAAIK
ncbi:MAG: tryptophan synthase subunit alpha [Candidatus Omnitrophica bacterium]|nr:tryptophan synthase subunit alpha [Candidatus Omnitrophota bacterium]